MLHASTWEGVTLTEHSIESSHSLCLELPDRAAAVGAAQALMLLTCCAQIPWLQKQNAAVPCQPPYIGKSQGLQAGVGLQNGIPLC